MKIVSSIVLLALWSFPLACRSTDSKASTVPCTCGQPAADIEGCAHEACASGQRNPNNPDCVCGTLSIPKSK
jgi:hypothetical protein